ncbi:MAG: tRNA modification GTPase [Pirellulales bacterium]|nr:tRNA modification GTPase [Pirellulales bacterium]
MDFSLDDTIVAIASPPGGGVRGIVRLSGLGTVLSVETFFTPEVPEGKTGKGSALPRTTHGQLRLPQFSSPVPCTLYLWPTNRSFTRQPSAELHTVGSSPLLDGIVRALCEHGARLARPGEFTLRAFLSGRLDLAQSEAVLSVIEAEDERELGMALRLAAGGLSGRIQSHHEALLELLAQLEAGLDFVDEDIEFISADETAQMLESTAASVVETLEEMSQRKVMDDRVRVVIVGAPNAGKSSLLNAIAGREAAIVSNQAGTTRDYLEVEVTLARVSLRLIDTAGVMPDDEIATNGTAPTLNEAAQRQTAAAVSRADVVLCCREANTNSAMLEGLPDQATVINVVTKSDQVKAGDKFDPNEFSDSRSTDVILTSTKTGEGIQALSAEIAVAAAGFARSESRMMTASLRRCHDALARGLETIKSAQSHVRPKLREELLAADIRGALEQLGQVTGAFYTDELLDRIFSRFCIGK